MRSVFHKFLVWMWPATFGGPLAIAAAAGAVAQGFPESRSWFSQHYFQARDAVPSMSAAEVVIIAGGIGLAWLVLVIVTAGEAGQIVHNHFHPRDLITSEVAAVSQNTEISGAIAAVTASSAEYSVSNGVAIGRSTAIGEGLTAEVNATQHRQTLTASAMTFPAGLYVAVIIVSAGELADEGVIRLAVRAYNGTDIDVRIAGADGVIKASFADTKDPISLPIPAFQPAQVCIGPRTEFLAVLEQRIPQRAKTDILKALSETQVRFDLRQLNIVVEDANIIGNRTRLPLWDGVSIVRRDDITTGRIHILEGDTGIFAAVGSKASLSMTVTRTDGTVETFES